MLCEIISQVGELFLPVDDERSLAGAVAHPVKPHVDGLEASLLHIVFVDATVALIICLDWSRQLWVDHFSRAILMGSASRQVS